MNRTKRDELTSRIIEGIRFGYQPELLQQMVEDLDNLHVPSAEDLLVHIGFFDNDGKQLQPLRLTSSQQLILVEALNVMLDREPACEADLETMLMTALAEWIESQKPVAEVVT